MTGRWTGLALALMVVIGTLWLAATGDLDLYVHPRYFVFTVVMAVLGGIVAFAAFLFLPSHEATEEAHEAHEATAPANLFQTPLLRVVGRLVVLTSAALAIFVLPPSTLTSAIAGTRQLNADAATEPTLDSGELAGGDLSALSIKDWAALLRQGLPDSLLDAEDARLTGFVLATESDDTFYLARYLITHCAIDAQPVGVPVHWPGWREELSPDSWLSIAGSFDANPTASADAPTVLIPSGSERIDEPDDPYVY